MLTQDECRIFFNLTYAKETQVEDRELYIKLFLIVRIFWLDFLQFTVFLRDTPTYKIKEHCSKYFEWPLLNLLTRLFRNLHEHKGECCKINTSIGFIISEAGHWQKCSLLQKSLIVKRNKKNFWPTMISHKWTVHLQPNYQSPFTKPESVSIFSTLLGCSVFGIDCTLCLNMLPSHEQLYRRSSLLLQAAHLTKSLCSVFLQLQSEQ